MVCSNSFRSDDKNSSAVGLMHHELREVGSLIMEMADLHKVPAGDALAVDRWEFAKGVTESLKKHPNIEIIYEEFSNLKEVAKDNIVIVATGPLTSDNLSAEIKEIIGGNSLNFFDAIAPIIYKDSIDFDIAWFQSRYDRNGSADYINCPLSEEEYGAFYDAMTSAQYHEFEDYEKDISYFEGCLPVEVMAKRGKQTLLFGPMKPVGLINPKTGEQPFAVVQLRQDNKLGTLYNMVGFQTKLIHKEQKRIFKMIPGLQGAEFAKLGTIHKNTFINSPVLLNTNLSLKSNQNIYFAGQITGCEGYVESTSIGFLAAIFVWGRLFNKEINVPQGTAFDAMLSHITINANAKYYQPMNINLGLFKEPVLPAGKKKFNKKEKKDLVFKFAQEKIREFKTC
jgi:methylenetetrahydrofolate--tRNA-(uracil-5-)-methyltransferase